MLSFECIKNEKSVYFLLTSAVLVFLNTMWAQMFKLKNDVPMCPQLILCGTKSEKR